MTVGGGTQRIYVDGAEKANGPWAAASAGANVVVVGNGASVDNGERFTGVIDDVVAYNQTLSAARVQAHYNAAANCTPANLSGSQFGVTNATYQDAVADAHDLGMTGCAIELVLTGSEGIDGLPTQVEMQRTAGSKSTKSGCMTGSSPGR